MDPLKRKVQRGLQNFRNQVASGFNANVQPKINSLSKNISPAVNTYIQPQAALKLAQPVFKQLTVPNIKSETKNFTQGFISGPEGVTNPKFNTSLAYNFGNFAGNDIGLMSLGGKAVQMAPKTQKLVLSTKNATKGAIAGFSSMYALNKIAGNNNSAESSIPAALLAGGISLIERKPVNPVEVDKTLKSVIKTSKSVIKPTINTLDVERGVTDILNKANNFQPQFESTLNETLRGLGQLYHGPIKEKARSVEKILNENGGDVSRLRDANRATITIHNPYDQNVVKSITDILGSKFNISRIKPVIGSNYDRIIVNITSPYGHEAELQITSPEMWTAKMEMGGDRLYKQVRSKVGDWRKAREKMLALYKNAKAQSDVRINSSSDVGIPSNSALSGGYGLPEAVTPNISSDLGSKSTLTSVPSTSKNIGNFSTGTDINMASTLDIPQNKSKVNATASDNILPQGAQESISDAPTEIRAGRQAIEEAKATINTPKVVSTKQQTLPAQQQAEQLTKNADSFGQPQTANLSQEMTQQTQIPVGEKNLSQSRMMQGVQQTADTAQKWTYDTKERLYTEFVDRFNPMSKLAKMAGKGKKLARDMARYYGTGSTADYHLDYELSPILKGHDLADLKKAWIAMRDIELKNREIAGSPEQANAVKYLDELKAKYGDDGMKELEATLQKLYDFQDNILKKYLVDTGIMSEATFANMKKNNNFYAPFKRVSEQMDEMLGFPSKGAGNIGNQNVVFKIKGSDKDIIDPLESVIENVYKSVSLGRRQRVAQTIASMSDDLPGLVKRTSKTDARDTIVLFENGKKVHYEVPHEVAEAARGMGEENLVMLAKILKYPTDLFRTSTTGVNPEFLVPNVARDVQSAFFNAGVNPLKWVFGLAHFAKRDDIYQEFLRAGGKTARVSLNRPYIQRYANELAGQGFTIKSPKDIIRGLEMISAYSEQPTRVMAFEKAYKDALKAGMNQEDALGEAAYWAQEASVNFARRGSKMSNINAVYAYLNARIQGVDRMFRSIKNDPKGAGSRLAVGFLAPSMALYAWNSQNPAYYDERILSERDKRDNFIFMLPKPVNGLYYIKLPKSEIGKVVNPVEEFLDYARGKDADIISSLLSVSQSMSPIDNFGGIIPTAINPVAETAFNKDFYTGYDLVPDYKQNLPAGYQDSSYTSPMYRMIGQKTNVSPAKLQNLAEGYGGGTLKFAEMTANRLGLIPDQYKSAKNEQGSDINRAPIIRRFAGGEKKSVEEQQKANVSKAKSVDFDIADVKSAVKRGDIPVEVGQQRIEELTKQKNEALGKAGQTSGGSNNELNKYLTDQEVSQVRDRVESSGQSETYNGVVYYRDNGSVKSLKTQRPMVSPVLTGNSELDKKLTSSFTGKISARQTEVAKLYEQGRISAEQAEKEIDRLEAMKNKAKGKKGRKLSVAKVSAAKVKGAKVKLPKQKRLASAKLKDMRVKSRKGKLVARKPKKLNLKQLRGYA